MLEELNENQVKSVMHTDGPLAVIAGAGSGKSKTLTTKIRYLIEEKNIKPNRIFAFTFTKKAAEEMVDKLSDIMDKNIVNRVKISTIHSMAYKILKNCRQNRDINYKMPKTMVNTGPILMHLFAFLKSGGYNSNDAKLYMANISGLKMNLITVDNFTKHIPYTFNSEKSRASEEQIMHEFYGAYQKFMKTKNYIDYTDMLVDCYYELIDPRNAEFVERIKLRSEYVMIDEFQDTNRIAYNIAMIISDKNKNVSVFGDTRQNIFSFQGADTEIMRDFLGGKKATVVDLPVNYRSTKTIVENANKLISYQKDTIGLPSTTPNEVGDPISHNTSHDMVSEANYISDLIENLSYHGKEYRDITILYRVHSQAVQIVNEFMVRNIPHIQFVKTNFFLRKEIKIILTYLKIAIEYSDAEIKDVKAIMHKPTRYISNLAIREFEKYIRDGNLCATDGLESAYAIDGINNYQAGALKKLSNQLSHLASMYKRGSRISSMIKYVCEDSGIGYENWAIADKIEREPDSDISMDFDALISTSNKFETLESFLEDIDRRVKESKKIPDEKANKIKLMSTHRSKGLEFDTVIVAGLNDRLYPFHMSVKEGNTDEERRIVYVAVTRPKKKLYLSAINGKMGRFNVKPSTYMYQMNINYNGVNNVSETREERIYKESYEKSYKEDYEKSIRF